MKKKAKIAWIEAGDEKTKLFNQSIKIRNIQDQVYNIHDMNGVWHDTPTKVSDAFLDFYTSLLGSTHPNRSTIIKQIVQAGPILTDTHRAILDVPYTEEEVKKMLFFQFLV